MKSRLLPIIVFSLALGFTGVQYANATSAPAQDSGNGAGAGGYGQRNGRGGFGGGLGMGIAGSSGIMGTVTEVAADHYTVKSENGEIYTIHFSANTRITKQPAGMRGPGGAGGGRQHGARSDFNALMRDDVNLIRGEIRAVGDEHLIRGHRHRVALGAGAGIGSRSAAESHFARIPTLKYRRR